MNRRGGLICHLRLVVLLALIGLFGLGGKVKDGYPLEDEPTCEDCEGETGLRLLPPLVRVARGKGETVTASTLSEANAELWNVFKSVREVKDKHDNLVLEVVAELQGVIRNRNSIDILVTLKLKRELVSLDVRLFRPIDFTVGAEIEEGGLRTVTKKFQVLPVLPDIIIGGADRLLPVAGKSVNLEVIGVENPDQCMWSTENYFFVDSELNGPAQGKKVNVTVVPTLCGEELTTNRFAGWVTLTVSCEGVVFKRKVRFHTPACPDDDD